MFFLGFKSIKSGFRYKPETANISHCEWDQIKFGELRFSKKIPAPNYRDSFEISTLGWRKMSGSSSHEILWIVLDIFFESRSQCAMCIADAMHSYKRQRYHLICNSTTMPAQQERQISSITAINCNGRACSRTLKVNTGFFALNIYKRARGWSCLPLKTFW